MPLESNHSDFYWCRPRGIAALVARPDAQQFFSGHPAGNPCRYIIGVAIAFFAASAALAPEWRLFVITGFCGGLTTFSTFSAEIVELLLQGRSLGACAAAALHLAGSVLMTFAGIGTVVWAKS